MKHYFKTVLFDFDGTIIDTSEGIYKSLQYAFAADGRPAPSYEELRRFIGPPIYDSFKNFYGYQDEKINFMVKKYRERYSDKGVWESAVYDGIPELLKELKNNGIKLATASSKPTHFIEMLLKYNNLYEYFDFVGGVAFDQINSKKSDIINNALSVLKADKNYAVMVGDRKFDINGAKGAGIPCIAVLYGFGSREEFIENSADFIAEAPNDIKKIILG